MSERPYFVSKVCRCRRPENLCACEIWNVTDRATGEIVATRRNKEDAERVKRNMEASKRANQVESAIEMQGMNWLG